MVLLLPTLLACTSVMRVPGPLASMRDDTERPTAVAQTARSAPTRPTPTRAGGTGTGQAIANAALRLEGVKSIVVAGETYRYDCSGFVEAAMAAAGFVYTGSTRDLFATAKDLGVLHRRHRPEIGDLAFFDDTYDRDDDGRVNDPLSHVAVVTAVDASGTVTMMHLGSNAVRTLTMNLRDPEIHKDEAGTLLNDYLRASSKRDGPQTRRLAGELWVAYGSLWKPSAVAQNP